MTSRVIMIFNSAANVSSGKRTGSVGGITCAVSDTGFALYGVKSVSPSCNV